MPSWLQKRLLIARRDWRETVRTRGFWLAALLGPVIGLVFIVVATVVAVSSFTSVGRYAVVDQSDGLALEVEQRLLGIDVSAFLIELKEKPVPDNADVDVEILNEIKELFNDGQSVHEVREMLIKPLRAELDGDDSVRAERVAEDFAKWWKANREFIQDFSSNISFSKFTLAGRVGTTTEEQAQEWLEQQAILGYFIVPADLLDREEPGEATYVTRNFLKDDLRDWYRNHLSFVVKQRKLDLIQLEATDAVWIQQNVAFNVRQVSDDGVGGDSQTGDASDTADVEAEDFVQRGAPIAYGYVMWFLVFYSTFALLTSVVEEKATKLVELLLSTVTPSELMDGKAMGVLFVIATTLGIWVGGLAIIGLLGVGVMPADLQEQVQSIIGAIFNPYYIAHFIFYLTTGYMFFGALLGAIGSVCSNIREAQSLAAPISMLMIVPIVVVYAVIIDPNSLAASILSYIPPFTPFVMMFRAADHPDLVTYLLINIWFLLWVVGARYLSRRVYTRGILMESKPEGFRQLAKLVRRAET